MHPNPTHLRRGLSFLAICAGWAVACTAGDPSANNETTSSDKTNSSTTDVDPTGIDLTGSETGGIKVEDKPPSANCGDGILDDEEACDDGTPGGGDGCGSNCLFVEEGFLCAEPGEPCRPYSKCGDGVTVPPEQCDGGATGTTGCSATCKLELGYKCSGNPSVCEATVCGDGNMEGTETCEDGNTLPFDGCDANCNKEPDCASASGMGCTSSCGDGLIIGDEQCDDGNGSSGDGCSADCLVEPGYMCSVPALDATLPLELPIVFRDFSTSHSDFQDPDPLGTNMRPCDGYSPGIAAAQLNAAGKPVWASSPAKSCVASAESFGQWYTESNVSDSILSSVTLYPNGKGGYVNRFGANGEPYLASVKTDDERQAGTSQATCEAQCVAFARDGQPPFATSLRCDDICRDDEEAVRQLQNNTLIQAENALTQAENANPPDPDAIAAAEAAIADVEARIVTAQEVAATCASDCQDDLDARVATCAPQCAPCSDGSVNWCIGGELLELDGNPLFFPIDVGTEMRSPVAERSAARIPAQVYQGLGWPWEDPSCTDGGTLCTKSLHNFAFTSEIAYWFEYDDSTVADLTFLGDDDVFVFINRHLVLDIGGIHVPLGGQLSLAAGGGVTTRIWEATDPGDDAPVAMAPINKTMTAADLGMTAGNVYEIKVFHAERKPEGSSFQLTLAGFNAPRSNCVATCGDGIIAGGEQCDNGTELNMGGHNGCKEDCTLGSFCGDGIFQPDEGEQCDDKDPATMASCSNCRTSVLR